MNEGTPPRRPAAGTVRSLAARVLARARHAPDRLKHRALRRKLLARLSAGPCPRTVLFVCLGNVCRSPYAAAAFERALPPGAAARVQIRSAGFLSPGRGCPRLAREAAAARGVDLSTHRSNALTATGLAEAQLVVVMEPRQAEHLAGLPEGGERSYVVLGDLDPDSIDTRSIPDPIDGPEELFQAIYARIDRCVGELAAAMSVSCLRPAEEPELPTPARPAGT